MRAGGGEGGVGPSREALPEPPEPASSLALRRDLWRCREAALSTAAPGRLASPGVPTFGFNHSRLPCMDCPNQAPLPAAAAAAP